MKLTKKDAGCWLDSARGRYIGEEVQKFAKQLGWTEDPLNADHEEYYNAWDEAEEFLNSFAPEGFYFGSNENSDWGLWQIEND